MLNIIEIYLGIGIFVVMVIRPKEVFFQFFCVFLWLPFLLYFVGLIIIEAVEKMWNKVLSRAAID